MRYSKSILVNTKLAFIYNKKFKLKDLFDKAILWTKAYGIFDKMQYGDGIGLLSRNHDSDPSCSGSLREEKPLSCESGFGVSKSVKLALYHFKYDFIILVTCLSLSFLTFLAEQIMGNPLFHF